MMTTVLLLQVSLSQAQHPDQPGMGALQGPLVGKAIKEH